MRDNESDKTNEPPSFVSETVEEKFAQLLVIAEKCVRERATTPALILIFSAIDVAGWLSAVSPSASPRSRFTGWVARYLLPFSNLDCSAIELFAARCGIVHNFSSESDLSRGCREDPTNSLLVGRRGFRSSPRDDCDREFGSANVQCHAGSSCEIHMHQSRGPNLLFPGGAQPVFQRIQIG